MWDEGEGSGSAVSASAGFGSICVLSCVPGGRASYRQASQEKENPSIEHRW
jgi:hypothetical protein